MVGKPCGQISHRACAIAAIPDQRSGPVQAAGNVISPVVDDQFIHDLLDQDIISASTRTLSVHASILIHVVRTRCVKAAVRSTRLATTTSLIREREALLPAVSNGQLPPARAPGCPGRCASPP